MRTRLSTLVLLGLWIPLSHCGSPKPTELGDDGDWGGGYLNRVYAVDMTTAHETAREYFQVAGYQSIRKDDVREKKTLLHGFTAGNARSLIFRAINRGDQLTEVRLKAGPAYDQAETVAMADAYEVMLPAAARRKSPAN